MPDYNMLKHIYEIPSALQTNLTSGIADIEHAASKIREIEPTMIVVSGCGASYHDAVSARYAFETLVDIPTVAMPAAELALYPDSFFGPHRLAILISRSGEKRDIMAASERLKRAGQTILAVTATPDSLLAGAADSVILTHEGSEHCQPKTKSYICVLASLIQLAIGLMRDGSRASELMLQLSGVPQAIERIIGAHEGPMRELASRLLDRHSLYITGSGSCYGSALEAALKLKETSFIRAEAFTTGEVTQGPLLLLDRGWTYVSFVLPSEQQLAIRVMEGAREWGAFALAIAQEQDCPVGHSDFTVELPRLGDELFASLTYIIPIYFLAYYTAVAKGLDPDNPLHFDRILGLILEPGRSEPEMRTT